MREPPPFMAVLLGCSDFHYEVNTEEAWRPSLTVNVARICARCGLPLQLIRTALIVPGRRHSEMSCASV